ncbi:hypothetical protein RMCBS344292_14602 [Rhizopus microsporus]|nr:hypothetical protein RMCBS344292_14602 [Rhizopus microsporus]
MSAENVSTKERGPYQPREERKHWGIYYLGKAGLSSDDDIVNIVEMPKTTVQSTVDRIKKTGSPIPTKPKCRTHKINERSQKLLMRTIGNNPFVTYDRLRLELHNVDVEVCRQTVICSLKRMEYGSCYAAQKPALTEEHMKKRLRWVYEHANWTVEQWSSFMLSV